MAKKVANNERRKSEMLLWLNKLSRYRGKSMVYGSGSAEMMAAMAGENGVMAAVRIWQLAERPSNNQSENEMAKA